jgi:hypothetical protein
LPTRVIYCTDELVLSFRSGLQKRLQTGFKIILSRNRRRFQKWGMFLFGISDMFDLIYYAFALLITMVMLIMNDKF